MADNMTPIGVDFQSTGLPKVQADLNQYRAALGNVLTAQRQAARDSAAAAQQQIQAAQQEAAARQKQIQAAQKLYQNRILEARETARATREKIAAYRLEATATEQQSLAIINALKQRAQVEGQTAEQVKAITQARIAQERHLAEFRRQTEREVENMRLNERRRLDQINASADRWIAKRRQLEESARREAAANRATGATYKSWQTDINGVVKSVENQIRVTEKEIKAQERLAIANQKAANKKAIADQKGILKSNEEAAAAASARYQKMTDVIGVLNPRMGFLTKSLGGMNAKLLTIIGTVGIVIAGLVALTKGVFDLGKAMYSLGIEGNQARETIQTFNNTVSALGGGINAKNFLEDLRKQTRGTIGDLELMQLSLRALQGTALEFRAAVAPKLGEIFDATARIARATGQSADVVREKFIYGLRREENRLLDDIGVKVDAVRANELFAESINKSVDALSEQEKQIAFTKEAVRQLQITAGELGDPNATIENVARIQATIDNIRLRMSLALAPFSDAVSTALSDVAELAGGFINTLAPGVYAVSNNFKALSMELKEAGISFDALRPAVDLTAKVFLVVLAVINDTISMIRLLVRTVQTAPEAFNNAFAGIPGQFGKIFSMVKAVSLFSIEDLAYLMAYGGGAVMGAFAEGLYMGLKPVVEAVTAAANLVADFLVGFSPPKKGPLSKIDIGGYNVGTAWVEGFMKGMLEIDKRSDVLKGVNQRLGDIRFMNMEQVDARLLQLDISLRPFQERLEIVKADMEALAGFVDPALESLERIQSRSIRALKTGGGDIEALRALDRQVFALTQIQDLRQDAIDQAQVQLALASSQQIQERTLLLIQKNRLGQIEEETDARDRAGSGAGGGAGETPTMPTGGFIPGNLPFPEDLFGGIELPNVMDDIARGLSQGFSSTSSIDDDLGGFQSAMDRLGEAKPGEKIGGLLSGITEKFNLLKTDVTAAVNELFDLDKGPLGTAIINTETFATSATGPLSTLLNYIVGKEGFSQQIAANFDYLFGSPEDPETVMGKAKSNFTTLTDAAKNAFQGLIDFIKGDFQLEASLSNTLISPMKNVLGSFGTQIENAIIGIIKGINDYLEEIPDIFGIGTIPIPEPGFITGLMGSNARGSLGWRGASMVGERGREIIAPSNPVDIFPNRATEAIIRMSQLIARNPTSQIIVVPSGKGGGGNSSVTNTFAPTFNTTPSRENAMLRSRQMYAAMIR